MKKFVTLTVGMLLCAYGANATEYTYSYEFTETNCANITADGTYDLGTDFQSTPVAWTIKTTPQSAALPAFKFNSGGLGIGQNAKPAKQAVFSTSGIPGTIKEIKVYCGYGSAVRYNVSITIGDTSVLSGFAATKDATTDPATVSGISASGEIVITFDSTSAASDKGVMIISKIEITYDDGSTGPAVLQEYTHTFANMDLATFETADIDMGSSAAPEGITFTPKDPAVATVTDGVVTGRKAGSTVVDVVWPEGTKYLAGSATFTVTVSAAECVTFDFNASNYGLDAATSCSNRVITLSVTDGSIKNNDKLGQVLSLTKNSGTITIGWDHGYMHRIKFTGGNTAKLTTTEGKFSNPEWQSGEVYPRSVSFAAGDGNVNIQKVSVVYSGDVTTGVENVVADSDCVREYYNLSGLRVEASDLTPGIYIVRQGDKVTKELVR